MKSNDTKKFGIESLAATNYVDKEVFSNINYANLSEKFFFSPVIPLISSKKLYTNSNKNDQRLISLLRLRKNC
jgi:hypothetical protein